MPDWITTLYALVPQPDQALVLMYRTSAGVMLPRAAADHRIWASAAAEITALFSEVLGLPVHVLRRVAFHRDAEAYVATQVHLLELRADQLPDNTLWLPLEIILEDDRLPAAVRAELRDWRAEQLVGRIPDQRAPWAFPGWRAGAERWIVDRVTALGRGAVINIEPIKSWSISCIWRIVLETGCLYFKATRDLPLWPDEAQTLKCLAEIYPGQIPIPLAFDASLHWMLLDDFGKVPEEDAPMELQTRMMQTYARLQIDSTRRVEALLAAGCKDRRIPTWSAHLALLVKDDLILEPLKPEERIPFRERFISKLPRLEALATELAALPIPAALVHGDLHSGNVFMHSDQMIFFDWTDAAISHPFMDMIHIFQEKDESKRAILQEAYLAIWEEIFPKEIVRKAWTLAQIVFGLYHAVSYYYIVHGIEPSVRAELNASEFYLQFALDHLEKYEA